jgi:hypothetical protein
MSLYKFPDDACVTVPARPRENPHLARAKQNRSALEPGVIRAKGYPSLSRRPRSRHQRQKFGMIPATAGARACGWPIRRWRSRAESSTRRGSNPVSDPIAHGPLLEQLARRAHGARFSVNGSRCWSAGAWAPRNNPQLGCRQQHGSQRSRTRPRSPYGRAAAAVVGFEASSRHRVM